MRTERSTSAPPIVRLKPDQESFTFRELWVALYPPTPPDDQAGLIRYYGDAETAQREHRLVQVCAQFVAEIAPDAPEAANADLDTQLPLTLLARLERAQKPRAFTVEQSVKGLAAASLMDAARASADPSAVRATEPVRKVDNDISDTAYNAGQILHALVKLNRAPKELEWEQVGQKWPKLYLPFPKELRVNLPLTNKRGCPRTDAKQKVRALVQSGGVDIRRTKTTPVDAFDGAWDRMSRKGAFDEPGVQK